MSREAITVDPATGQVTEITADAGEAAFALDQELDQALFDVERGAIRAARIFYEIKHWGHYRALGYDTFWEYVASKRQGRRWVTGLIDVHETFRLRSSLSTANFGDEESTYVDRLCQIGTDALRLIAGPYAASEGDAEREEWLSRAETLSRSDLEHAVREWRHGQKQPAVLPPGVFDLLYVDPPWRYEFVEAENRAIENQYPTMSLDEIKALELPQIAPDALLLMWATSPKLTEALEVVEAWGFEYRSCLVWVKHAIGMGYWARQRHELLLVCKAGDFPAPAPEDRPDSVIEAPREEHSKKPDQVYALIERMFPNASKIELFCRRPREGWASWGNEG